MVGPMIAYYLKTSEENTLFPATISFCCRKGVPMYIHFASILTGFALYLFVMFKGNVIVKALVTFMCVDVLFIMSIARV